MLSLPPPPMQETETTPLNQIVLSKQAMNGHSPAPLDHSPNKSRRPTPPTPPNQTVLAKQTMNGQSPAVEYCDSRLKILKQAMNRQTPTRNPIASNTRKPILLPQPRRTNPVVWFASFLCIIFSLLLIIAGIATLIIFLVIKPRYPLFDIPNASLNTIYLDSVQYMNGDFTFLANFSNPNRKMDLRFEYIDIELYFSDRLIGTLALQPFTQKRGEARLESVHMISSLLFLPLNLSMELQKQVQSNRVKYNIKGTFKVRATLGLMHFSYWLYGRCQVVMTDPPNGVLVARSCRTKSSQWS